MKIVRRALAWRDPLEVAAGIADREGALCLLSDGGAHGRWSWVGAGPDRITVLDDAGPALFGALKDTAMQAGVIGLASYDAGAAETVGRRESGWPDLILARYPALLRFDHATRSIEAIGFGETAEADCLRAEGWRDSGRIPERPETPAETFEAEAPDDDYRGDVAAIVARIRAGDLFQANIARGWGGMLKDGADPFDVFVRLASQRAAPYGAFWRIGDRALVSNSPELFLTFDPTTRRIETRPIKGTRGRGADAAADDEAVADLVASAKDRAENLMIVDLMRNDLSRVATPGTVRVQKLFEVESHPTVHHLVSTVSGVADADVAVVEILDAAFPPGSITGAPKHQAMKVIAAHEPPRGPWCGSLFLIDPDGALTASVLIRTASFERERGRWRYRTLAGAGIVADSDPDAELTETEIKISALRTGLTGG